MRAIASGLRRVATASADAQSTVGSDDQRSYGARPRRLSHSQDEAGVCARSSRALGPRPLREPARSRWQRLPPCDSGSRDRPVRGSRYGMGGARRSAFGYCDAHPDGRDLRRRSRWGALRARAQGAVGDDPECLRGRGGPWPPVDHAVAQPGQAAVERLGADRLERPRDPEPCRPGLAQNCTTSAPPGRTP